MSSVRIYNAAGPRSKEIKDLEQLLRTPVPVIQIGSVTEEAHAGNATRKWWIDPASGTSLNSFGLPNRGLPFYETQLPSFMEKAHAAGKSVRVSIAGFTPAEFGRMTKRLARLRVDEVELNAGCPNVWRGRTQKRIPSFDLPLLDAILAASLKNRGGMRVDIKLSPYSDPHQLRSVAALLAKHTGLSGVVLSNTYPNAYAGSTGLAGLAGPALHHIALGQVHQFRQLLPKRLRVVGLGGALDAASIRRFTKAGADEVQVGTHYFKNGPGVFAKLL